MMARFVVRLLEAAGELLAWADVPAVASPQQQAASCPFWPTIPTAFHIERDGTVTQMSVQWADLGVARIAALAPVAVQAGQVFHFTWIEPVWLVPGMRDVPLPSVTVRAPVQIAVPVGAMGARDPRVG